MQRSRIGRSKAAILAGELGGATVQYSQANWEVTIGRSNGSQLGGATMQYWQDGGPDLASDMVGIGR